MKPCSGMGRLQRVGAEAGCAPASRGPKAPWGTRRMYHGSWRPGSSPNASRFCPNRRWPLFRGLAIQETQVADFNVEGRTRQGKVERKVRGRIERERDRRRGRGGRSSVSALSSWALRPRVLAGNTPGGAVVSPSKCSPSALSTDFCFPLSRVDRTSRPSHKTIVPFYGTTESYRRCRVRFLPIASSPPVHFLGTHTVRL